MTENDKETFKSYRYIRILCITELRLKGKLLSLTSMKSANKKDWSTSIEIYIFKNIECKVA